MQLRQLPPFPWVIFTRRWILGGLLALAAAVLFVRLGFWQLDRLDQRRAFNSRVQAQISTPVLVLNRETTKLDLAPLEYRQVQVSGEYDFSQQVVLRNQVWGNILGVHLLTPLRIDDSNGQPGDLVILVDRGWIPAEDMESSRWSQYDEPGKVTVTGVIRRAQTRPDFGNISDSTPAPGGRLEAWHLANIPAMAQQMDIALLPVYIQQAPEAGLEATSVTATDRVTTTLPYRSQPELNLSEGPHQGYAIQWFTFAGIALLGFPLFVYREEQRARSPARR